MSKEFNREITEAVVSVASDHAKDGHDDGVITLSTGVRVKLSAVSTSLIDEVTSRIEDPEVPMWMNEDKGREEPNPIDPKYLKALEKAQHDRGLAAMDALIMFGVELIDEIPDPKKDNWAKKLKLLGVDIELNDELLLEFAYKKYIAVSPVDMDKITKKSGITQEELAKAEELFQRQD